MAWQFKLVAARNGKDSFHTIEVLPAFAAAQ